MESGCSSLAGCSFGVGQGLCFLSESQHTDQRFVDSLDVETSSQPLAPRVDDFQSGVVEIFLVARDQA